MGTKFSLKDSNPGEWFAFEPDRPNSGKICLRVLTPAKSEEIEKATTKTRFEWRMGQRFKISDTDDSKKSELTWDYMIVGWEGLEDNNDKPIECTFENKVFLMRNELPFFIFVMACIAKINTKYEEIREAVEKN